MKTIGNALGAQLRTVFGYHYISDAKPNDKVFPEDITYISTEELSDGIIINLIENGHGDQCSIGEKAEVHYEGTLDGKVFDSSIERGVPIEFVIGRMTVIKCWETAMTHMKKGEKADIFCPASTAYGSRAMPGIPADSDLNFNIEVVNC